MSTQSNAVAESLGARELAPVLMHSTQPFLWSVRRELWEFRSIYIAPLAVAAVTMLGFLFATLGRALSTSNMAERREVLEGPFTFASLLIMLTTFLVAVFYCLEALHGERRDRSILFWKSVPVSDLTTVFAKASIPLVILPLLTFTITIVMQFVMFVLSSLVLSGSGLGASMLWAHWVPMTVMLFYHLIAVHSLSYAPMYGWLMLVSGWARRAAFLWATLPLLTVGLIEKIAFNTTHFGQFLGNQFSGGRAGAFMEGDMMMSSLAQLTPGRFLLSPELWLGLMFTALCLAGAVRLRRYRSPM
ncbi:MAG TPA: ABC transporter permease [Terriglobales bacterium]